MAIKRLTPGLATLEAVSVMGNHLKISRTTSAFGEILSVQQHPTDSSQLFIISLD
jgi:hypothetical protein